MDRKETLDKYASAEINYRRRVNSLVAALQNPLLPYEPENVSKWLEQSKGVSAMPLDGMPTAADEIDAERAPAYFSLLALAFYQSMAPMLPPHFMASLNPVKKLGFSQMIIGTT